MSDETRRRGRPTLREHEVGRDVLLERARAAMNVRPRTDILRREIAEMAGVTPALINYYFADKWQLLEAAAQPIVEAHVVRIHELLSAKHDVAQTLKSLISHYIVFNREHGYLLDYYILSSDKLGRAENLELLSGARAAIIAFFRSAIREKHLREMDPEILQALVWGLCKHLPQLSSERHEQVLRSYDEADVNGKQTEIVCNLPFNGVLASATAPREVGDAAGPATL